ncbi:ABC transporter substrate-binding protein [Pontibacter ruber]|uniref:ABC transporter substrate-binding protein n=1 Tax=Pontibacter ruber TaxID=1343895 RepID=A0ABW5CVG6_9BACT|nr:ABC transporter substrate-binding protein [Pontibacter ruber]
MPDEVRVRFSADPETLNPVNYSDAGAIQIINLLFHSLLSVDLESDGLKPALAASMPQVERKDSLTYFTYTLRKEAEWASGAPVTAEDVAFTLKVLKAPLVNNESIKPQVEFIQDIILDKEDPRKFTLLCKGYAPEMELLTGDFFILPAYLFDPAGLLKSVSVRTLSSGSAEPDNNGRIKAFAERFNSTESAKSKEMLQGSGGYLLDSWVPGQYITLKRKESWWGKELGNEAAHLTANPARISFQIIPDNTTALLALKNHQLDVLENIAVAEFRQLQQDKSFLEEYTLHTPNGYEFVYAGLNSRLPKFSDKRTRQAIAHLLDVNSLISVVQQSQATPTVGIVPPSVKKFYNSELTPYKHNVQKAKQLLAAAGWKQEKDGWYKNISGTKEKLTIDIVHRAGSTGYQNSALIFQQSAAKAGIPVTIQALDGSYLSQRIGSHEFDMFFRALSGNPFAFNFKPLLHTSAAGLDGFNTTGFGNAQTDKLLDAINAARTDEEKALHLKKLQQIMQEEATLIPLYYLKERIAIHKRFTNTKVSGLEPNYDVSAFLLKN